MWIERQRYFLDLAVSSLLRRKGKNGALLIVYTLMVFLLSSVIFFSDAIRKEAEGVLQDAPEMIVQRTVGGRHALFPLSDVEKLGGIRGVRSVTPRFWGYYFHPASRSNYTLMVPQNFSHADEEIEVGQGVLRTWESARGNLLYFRAHDGRPLSLKIVKTFGASTELVTSDLILLSETAYRKISGVPAGFATDLAVEIGNARESQIIAEKIVLALPDARPILRKDIMRTYASLFDWRSGYVLVLLSGSVLAFFIFAWDKATGLSGEERVEIGILKGLGWETSDILIMKFWEGTVISLSAFLLGVIGGYVHVFFSSAPLFQHALKGWATLYPAFRLNPEINPYALAVLFFLTILPYTLISVIPTWGVAVIDPDKVMRQG